MHVRCLLRHDLMSVGRRIGLAAPYAVVQHPRAIISFPTTKAQNQLRDVVTWFQGIRRSPPSQPRIFDDDKAEKVPLELAIEEETLPNYVASRYHPVRIGEIFESKYQVISKLGYGITSTVWLARDLRAHKYVVLKFYIAEDASKSENNIELIITQRVADLKSRHVGARCVRSIIDRFELGKSPCLVYEPLGWSLEDLHDMLVDNYTPELLHSTLFYLMQALEFLHEEVNIIHTDIKSSNILMKLVDTKSLQVMEEAEMKEPCPRKLVADRTIYRSRLLPMPKGADWGIPVLIDFGEARIGKQKFTTHVQPAVYRAPEILLEMDWDHKVDIWNLGVLAWDFLENKHLFDGHDKYDNHSQQLHLAEMVGLLGQPPAGFLHKSPVWKRFFSEDGSWRSKEISIPQVTLEEGETQLEGEEKRLFLAMIRSMLQWDPAKRPTARELRTQNTWMLQRRKT